MVDAQQSDRAGLCTEVGRVTRGELGFALTEQFRGLHRVGHGPRRHLGTGLVLQRTAVSSTSGHRFVVFVGAVLVSFHARPRQPFQQTRGPACAIRRLTTRCHYVGALARAQNQTFVRPYSVVSGQLRHRCPWWSERYRNVFKLSFLLP